MPSHVWKCDHCSKTAESFDEVNNHEKECEWNPKNKYCYTCSNYSPETGFYMYGESYTCLKDLKMDYFEDHGGCKGWQ